MIDRATHRICILSSLTGILSVFLVSGAVAAQLLVPQNFSTIQEAIDAAAAGDEVIVSAGSYSENLMLKSEVSVRGIEAARTFLRPAITDVAVVSANLVDDVLLRNFTLVDAQVGVDVVDSTAIRIANLVIDSASQLGIRVSAGSQVEILNSVFWKMRLRSIVRRSTRKSLIARSPKIL
jgi:polygalacturonase